MVSRAARAARTVLWRTGGTGGGAGRLASGRSDLSASAQWPGRAKYYSTSLEMAQFVLARTRSVAMPGTLVALDMDDRK